MYVKRLIRQYWPTIGQYWRKVGQCWRMVRQHWRTVGQHWRTIGQHWRKGLWELVTGEEEEPIVVPTDPASVLARKEWRKRSFQAVHYIALTVGASYIGHIQDCDSPKKAWDALSNLFQSGTETRKLQLLQQFNSVNKSAMCINDFVNQIKSLADQLASVKVAVDSTVFIGTTLKGLPSEYKQFVTSIATREPLPTFEQLVPMMLGEEVRMGAAASSSQQSEQIYYAGYGGSRGRGRGRGYQGGSQRQPQGRGQQQQQQMHQQPQQQTQQQQQSGAVRDLTAPDCCSRLLHIKAGSRVWQISWPL
ncbi:hypothetical protein R1sor_011611 [Riccia sorocarpa]|uniref:Gag protein n=1 Tax=Riccia sorocarpa TaxID=122646 RepID=A0ABD3I592_9MARC